MRRRALTVAVITALAIVALPPTADAGPTIHPTEHERVDGLPAAEVDAGFRAQAETEVEADAEAGELSEPIRTPIPFDTVGFESPTGGDVWVRTSLDGETWSEWYESENLADDDSGPDPDSAEAAEAADLATMTEPVWVREAKWLQIRVEGGSVADVGVELMDSLGRSRSAVQRAFDAVRTAWRGANAGTPASAAQPDVVSRAGWGANESWAGTPAYTSDVRYSVVHHTAGTNAYSEWEAPGIVRSIYRYHTQSLGWRDIGYNVLVDRYGTIYEGRKGGLERAVIGAHAAGFNAGSFGISVLGRFTNYQPPWEARRSVAEMIAWKFGIHGIDPEATITVRSAGGSKYSSGTEVRIPTVIGHRDVGRTECPGDAWYPQLDHLRRWVVDLMPKERFLDVRYDSVHAPNILAIADAGITRGCSDRLYCPDDDVRRREMASFLQRTFDLPQELGNTFVDVNNDSTHAPDIYAIARAEITQGCDDTLFCPRDSVTRQEMASFLARAIGLEPVSDHPFTDVGENAHTGAIGALAETGITQGCQPDRFCPHDPVTRAEMATFLERTREHLR